jgi:tRNA(His) 5'-end guanylyltransferase
MKDRELYSRLAALPPVFIRLDGRNFHRNAERWNLDRPFDTRFAEAMTAVSVLLVSASGLAPDLAFTFSDEINLYFSCLPFNGRVEKVDSVTASFAASALTIEMQSSEPISFDARTIHVTPALAVQYLIQRQGEAWRNHLNAYCQHLLIEGGMSRREAAAHLRGLPSQALHELAHSRGFNLSHTPTWERRGTMVYKRVYPVQGFNPATGAMQESMRSEVVVDRELPVFSSPAGLALLALVIRNP